jgi:hypothetical protein
VHFVFFCSHNKRFHVTCKGGHRLRTQQACICDIVVRISTALEVIGHFLFKGWRPWDHPVSSWLHTITCSLIQGTKIYTLYWWGSQRFSRMLEHLWFKNDITIPYGQNQHIPPNAPWHKEHQYRITSFVLFFSAGATFYLSPE